MLDTYLGVELLNHKVTLYLTLWELFLKNYQTVLQNSYTISHLHCNAWRVQFLCILNIFICPFDFSHLSQCELVSQCDFDLHFLKTNDIEHFVMCSWDITYHLWRNVCRNLLYIIKTELFLTLLSGENSLYFMDTSPLPDMWFINIFFQSVCCLYIFLPGILCNRKVFGFDENQFIYFLFIVCAFCVISKKLLPNLRFGRFTPMFSSKHVIVLALAFLDMIHFELVFLHCVL